MIPVQHGLGFVDVDGAEPGPALAQGTHERAFLDEGRAARIDEQRRRLHAREVAVLHEAAGFAIAGKMDADHVRLLEKRLAARRHREAVRARARRRAFAPPAHDVHAERVPDTRNDAADAPVRVDAQRSADDRGADRGLPPPRPESMHLVGNMAQRRQYQPPGQFRGMVRPPFRAAADEYAPLAARGEVNVAHVAARLADQLQTRNALRRRARHGRALLQQDRGVRVAQPRGKPNRVLLAVVIHHELVTREPLRAGEAAKNILIVVQNRDTHGASPPGGRASLFSAGRD